MLWSFKSKYNLLKQGLLEGMTDIHSHILPGVDDGSPDIQTSLSLLSFMEQIGFREVWLTPHIMADFPTPNEELQQRLAKLKSAYQGNIDIRLASEYMMDASFTHRLGQGEVLPLGNQHLLVETSYMYSPPGLQDILKAVWNAGYQPIIAHPERYNYMDERDYLQLREKGYSFQLNLMSLSGYYGPRPKDVSEKLLKERMYDYVGSDLHHLERYKPMLEKLKLTREQLDALQRLLENNRLINQ